MALIPPFFSDCVVAMGVDDEKGGIHWGASGFLYGHCVSPKNTDLEDLEYRIFLVTNKHVIRGHNKMYVRVNPIDESTPAKGYELLLSEDDGKALFQGHPSDDVDVAVVPINFDMLKTESMQTAFFVDRRHTLNASAMHKAGVSEGDPCFVLGFPMGLVGTQRNTVIVRGGTIARIRETFAASEQQFLVDSIVFPGNSGGPVVNRPTSISIEGTDPITHANLIGVVCAYLPYSDIAVSQQTGNARVIFEENSGLAAVFSVDCIRQTVIAFLRTARKEEKAPLKSSKKATEDSIEIMKKAA